uniref:Uncharacterized protein n=1 Tax=Anguilla anguilla TaxID=7936 RepID=A0A0E9S598_ANGAN
MRNIITFAVATYECMLPVLSPTTHSLSHSSILLQSLTCSSSLSIITRSAPLLMQSLRLSNQFFFSFEK